MPSEPQKIIQRIWGEDIPIDIPFSHPDLRQSLIQVMLPLVDQKTFELCSSIIEIGPRLRPYSFEMASTFNSIVKNVFFTDVAYKQLTPNFSFGDAHIDISSRGVPRDDHKILKLLGEEPSVLFLPSVLCYIAGASARKLMKGAQQVVVVNNHLAGAGLPYNGRARSLPEEILEDLSNAGLNKVKVIQGEYFLAGVFQR